MEATMGSLVIINNMATMGEIEAVNKNNNEPHSTTKIDHES